MEATRGLLVVVGDGDRRCDLLVDELLGEQQVAAKSLGEGIGKVPGVSAGEPMTRSSASRQPVSNEGSWMTPWERELNGSTS